MKHSTLELVLMACVRQLEHELEMYRTNSDAQTTIGKFMRGEEVDLSHPTDMPILQIPLYGTVKSVVDKMQVTVIARTANGFAAYASGKIAEDPRRQIEVFDMLMERVQKLQVEWCAQELRGHV